MQRGVLTPEITLVVDERLLHIEAESSPENVVIGPGVLAETVARALDTGRQEPGRDRGDSRTPPVDGWSRPQSREGTQGTFSFGCLSSGSSYGGFE